MHSRQSTAKQPPQAPTDPTIGDVICEQLLDVDCSAQTLATVWMDVKSFYKRDRMSNRPASEFMVDALFSACARTGGGFDGALELLRDGKKCGAMSGAAQIYAICALMKWCGEDALVSFEFVVNEVDEWERHPRPSIGFTRRTISASVCWTRSLLLAIASVEQLTLYV